MAANLGGEAMADHVPRVAYIYGDYPPKPEGQADGGADFLQQLARRIVQRGIRSVVIVSSRADRPTGYNDDGVLVEPVIRSWRLRRLWSELQRIRGILEREHVNVIHAIYPDPYIRYGSDSYHLPFALKLLGVRLVVTFFGFGVTDSGPVSKLGLAALFAQADHMVITDTDLLHRFNRRFPLWSRKAEFGLVGSIAPEGSPRWKSEGLAERRQALGLDPQCRNVGFFGFWLPGKGLEDLIEAIARLRSADVPVRLVLIGGRDEGHRTPYERGIRELARTAGISPGLIETGPLSPSDVVAWLTAMDACVLPFHANPLGRSSLALSLQLGVPTVVTRPKSNAGLLDGVTLLDAPDADHITDALRPILGDPGLQQQTSDAAVRAAVHWSWESVAGRYADIYGSLAEAG